MILCHGLEAIGAIVECAREHRYFITGNVIADIGTVTQRVYFDAVHISLTNQIVDAYTRRTGVQISPFARSLASAGLAIADPVVQKLISPEALSQLLAVGWPVTAVPEA
jgi:Protein of unknown function (DUF2939)